MPNLLTETVAILIDLSVRKEVFKHQLPALGRTADLAQWKTLLTPRPYTPPEFAKVMRGEWNTTARYFLLPVLVDEGNPNRPPDADKLARAFAEQFSKEVGRLQGQTLAQQVREPAFETRPVVNGFSDKSREFMELLMVGSQAWYKGYVRASSTMDQYQAAFELLMLEQSGGKPVTGPLTTLTRDPISDESFSFDAGKRVIIAPAAAESREVKPLSLPW